MSRITQAENIGSSPNIANAMLCAGRVNCKVCQN